jgi:hypothetical protein
MATQVPDFAGTLDDALVQRMDGAIETAIRTAPNNDLLRAGLYAIGGQEQLVLFLHRFLLFNDALAARVPFLAGWIHLNPDLFADPDDVEDFCRQRNASIAAHIAKAASDEYHLEPGRNMVHQHLSQRFFRGVLGHYGLRGASLDRDHPIAPPLAALLREARSRFFGETGASPVFAGIGFHVGLEFFANEEFNLVDRFLCERHPELVATLQRDDTDTREAPYLWLALHTVVEIGHYRAGLEAVRDAIRYCRPREAAPRYARDIMGGLDAFADLQRRFYRMVLIDQAAPA